MIEKFVDENVEKDLNNFVSFGDLRKRYVLFCKFYNIKPVSKMKFAHDLGKHEVGTNGNKTINYVRLRGRHNVRLLQCKY